MKSYFAATALATVLATTSVNAGSLSDPIVEQDIVMEHASATSSMSATAMLLIMSVLMFATAVK
ncbi:MAG: hypothetical protein CSA70_09440 [Rhodobacterales bacterium]|nr:MAG: hypothetical protein CSA70_09440 [Rhodobacterales bacterium]